MLNSYNNLLYYKLKFLNWNKNKREAKQKQKNFLLPTNCQQNSKLKYYSIIKFFLILYKFKI